MHLFRFFMEYNEDFKMRAQVLFFRLYDSERPIEPEIKEQKEKASKKKQKAGEDVYKRQAAYNSVISVISGQDYSGITQI